MLASEIIQMAREDYLDDTRGENLWSDASMLRYLNEAGRQVCTRGDYIFDATTPAITRATVTPTKNSFKLHKDITRIKGVFIDGVKIPKKTREEMDFHVKDWRTATQGQTVFIVSGRNVTITPLPVANTVVTLEVYRSPKLIEDLDSEPELIPEYHRDLVYWICYEALSKRDADTLDGKKANEYLAKFDNVFGRQIPSDVRQNQLEASMPFVSRPFSYTQSRATNKERW